MMTTLYESAAAVAGTLAVQLRAVLRDAFVGLYLVGSYALADLQAQSDVDFVAVVEGSFAAATVDEVREVHARIASDLPLEGFYFERSAMPKDPDPASAHGWHFFDNKLRQNDEVRPVEWEMLRRCGHVIAGCPVADLGIFDSGAALADFSRRNLSDYWVPWLDRTAPYLMSDEMATSDPAHAAWAAAWCVLGIPRLYIAIADGEIVSKTEAGLRARELFDSKWHGVLDAALEHRRSPSSTSIARLLTVRQEAIDFSRIALEAGL